MEGTASEMGPSVECMERGAASEKGPSASKTQRTERLQVAAKNMVKDSSILLITEAWLCSSIADTAVEPAGCTVHGQDRRRDSDSCQLTLDPNTANRHLSLSGGNRKVTWGEEEPYPDHPERFDGRPQVLCRESLTGRCYWEAEWDEGEARIGAGALIGVTYKGIRRKGGRDCLLGFNDKSWSLRCDPDSYSVWHNNKETLIPIQPSGSRRVGVYLDWGAGALSFYRVSSDGLTLLYRFTSSFTEPLCPGFAAYDKYGLRMFTYLLFKPPVPPGWMCRLR